MEETKFEIEVEKVIPQKVETITYERDFIEKQIIEITKQRDEMIALKEAEIADCEEILRKMDEQNVVSKEQFNATQVAEVGVEDGLN